jgi:thymidylate synthase (FAD)
VAVRRREAVDHPAHYGGADNPYEAIKVIEAWKLGFCLGNTVKYIARAEHKGATIQDLEKARWYLDREIATRTAAAMAGSRPVLDHGFVRLVDSMGGDLSIVRAARVSYDADWRAGEDQGSDARLINYLWKNAHTSPFEAVTLTFEVKAPIFVFRQWHRHRTWSYNELSARYRELPEEFYLPDPALVGEQSASNKQMRVIGDMDADDRAKRTAQIAHVGDHCHYAFELYRKLIESGWPRELARSVLPVSTYSHMFATVDLLNLLKFLTLRVHEHAQYEIRVYAEAMRDLARDVAPVAIGAWERHLQAA